MKFSNVVAPFRKLRLPLVKASTKGFYEQHLEHHLIPAFGEFELEQITRLQIERFLATKSSLSWSSRRGILASLSAVLAAAVEWRAIDYNPAKSIALPRKTQKYGKAFHRLSSFVRS